MVNYLAVIVVSIMSVFVSALWYSPVLFVKQWMKLSGVKNMKMTPGKVILGFVSNLVLSFILALFIIWLGVNTFLGGMSIGFFVWVGFIITSMLGINLWENKPFALYLINITPFLVTLVVSGGILAVWM